MEKTLARWQINIQDVNLLRTRLQRGCLLLAIARPGCRTAEFPRTTPASDRSGTRFQTSCICRHFTGRSIVGYGRGVHWIFADGLKRSRLSTSVDATIIGDSSLAERLRRRRGSTAGQQRVQTPSVSANASRLYDPSTGSKFKNYLETHLFPISNRYWQLG